MCSRLVSKATCRTLLLITLFALSVQTPAHAQARSLEVETGKQFSLRVETALQNPLYSWVLMDQGRMITSQSAPVFSYTPSAPGSFELTLTIRMMSGEEERHQFTVRSIQAPVIHGDRTAPMKAILRTHPTADASKNVQFPAAGGTISLFAEESTGPIVQYAIDLNMQEDTSGDGIPNNDADNAYHLSHTTGERWEVNIQPGEQETRRTMQLMVLNSSGEVQTDQVSIVFDPEITPTSKLKTVPRPDSGSNTISLPGDGGVVRFDASESFGGIRLYALDLDLDHDSDSDGTADNDNDVSGTQFSRDGSAIYIFIKRDPAKSTRRIALRTAATDNSWLSDERTIQFLGAPSSDQGSDGAPVLISEPEMLHVGEQFTLRVKNPPSNASKYLWDLHADGSEDSQTEKPELLLAPDAPGVLPVRVILQDPLGSPVRTLSAEFSVLSAVADPINGDVPPEDQEELSIAATMRGLSGRFEPRVNTPLNIDRLQPEWTFGDGARSFLLQPEHTYESAGTYTVRIVFTDLTDQSEVASAQATIKTTLPIEGEEDVDDGPSILGLIVVAVKSIVFFLVKLVLLTIFFVIILGLPVVAYLLVVARKKSCSIVDAFMSEYGRISARITGKEISKIDEPLSAEVIETTEDTAEAVSKVVHPEILEGKKVEAPVEMVSGEVTEATEVDIQTSQERPSEGATVAEAPPPVQEEGLAPTWLQATPSSQVPEGESVVEEEREISERSEKREESETQEKVKGDIGMQEEAGSSGSISGEPDRTKIVDSPAEAPAVQETPEPVIDTPPEPASPLPPSPEGPVPAWLQKGIPEQSNGELGGIPEVTEATEGTGATEGTEGGASDVSPTEGPVGDDSRPQADESIEGKYDPGEDQQGDETIAVMKVEGVSEGTDGTEVTEATEGVEEDHEGERSEISERRERRDEEKEEEK